MPVHHPFKQLDELFQEENSQEAYRLLMRMQSRYAALREELTILKLQNRQLKDVLCLSENLFADNGVYWLKTSGVTQGPFCPECYDRDGALTLLTRGETDAYCPICGAVHGRAPVPAHEAPIPVPERRQARVLRFAR